MMKKTTSWGEVANWYEDFLKGEGTYQKDLILPNLKRLMDIKKGESVLDLACGHGFFSREFHKLGAKTTGVDISQKLIEIARQSGPKDIDYQIAPANKISFIKSGSMDKAAMILAVQNIDNLNEVFTECFRVLKSSGKLLLVMSHPVFRVLKRSSWGWAEQEKIQYRRVDGYLSESKEKIQMFPGDKPEEYTLSFHRPLQYYFKILRNAGFFVSRLEEWESNKKSQPGPRAKAEDIARKEIPLFLFLEAIKY